MKWNEKEMGSENKKSYKWNKERKRKNCDRHLKPQQNGGNIFAYFFLKYFFFLFTNQSHQFCGDLKPCPAFSLRRLTQRSESHHSMPAQHTPSRQFARIYKKGVTFCSIHPTKLPQIKTKQTVEKKTNWKSPGRTPAVIDSTSEQTQLNYFWNFILILPVLHRWYAVVSYRIVEYNITCIAWKKHSRGNFMIWKVLLMPDERMSSNRNELIEPLIDWDTDEVIIKIKVAENGSTASMHRRRLRHFAHEQRCPSRSGCRTGSRGSRSWADAGVASRLREAVQA